MRSALVRKVRWVVIALMMVAMLAYIRRTPWDAVLITMHHTTLKLLVLALCFHLLALSGKAGIWWTFLHPLGGPRLTTVARGTLMGATLNSLFVGSSGEAGRVLLMSRLTGIPSASVVATVVLERAVDLCGFLTLLACAVFLYPVPRTLTIGASMLLGVAVAIATLQTLRRRRGRELSSESRASHSIVRRCQRYLERVFVCTRVIATRRRFAFAFALTLLDWCSELTSYALVARAAHFPLGVGGSLLALLAVNVGFLVRVTPGNVGVFELVYATVAHSLGLPTDVAIGVALMLHLVQDVPTSILGLTLGARLFGPTRPPTSSAPEPLTADRLEPLLAITSSHSPRTEPTRGMYS